MFDSRQIEWVNQNYFVKHILMAVMAVTVRLDLHCFGLTCFDLFDSVVRQAIVTNNNLHLKKLPLQ